MDAVVRRLPQRHGHSSRRPVDAISSTDFNGRGSRRHQDYAICDHPLCVLAIQLAALEKILHWPGLHWPGLALPGPGFSVGSSVWIDSGRRRLITVLGDGWGSPEDSVSLLEVRETNMARTDARPHADE
jgi:hypothetical protein